MNSVRRDERMQQGNMNQESSYAKYHKLSNRAEDPYKERSTDVGWDITLIARTDSRIDDDTGKVNYFSTGLQFRPPDGYYIKLMARNTLHKSGYMLATGASIIEPGNTGELLVPLYKFADTESLELPFRGVQVIIEKKSDRYLIPSADSLDNSPNNRSNQSSNRNANNRNKQQQSQRQPESFPASSYLF